MSGKNMVHLKAAHNAEEVVDVRALVHEEAHGVSVDLDAHDEVVWLLRARRERGRRVRAVQLRVDQRLVQIEHHHLTAHVLCA